jgi:hypothetical protein
MGDVKRSGKTFEQRKAEAIAKQKAEVERRMVIRAKAEEMEITKTPEQKLKERHARMKLMMLLGMTGAYRFPYKK